MSTSVRAAGGVMEQGTTEVVAYAIDFTKWIDEIGEYPVSWNGCTVYDKTDGIFVPHKLSGVGSVSGNLGVTQLFSCPEYRHVYQLVIALNFPGSKVYSSYVQIIGKI